MVNVWPCSQHRTCMHHIHVHYSSLNHIKYYHNISQKYIWSPNWFVKRNGNQNAKYCDKKFTWNVPIYIICLHFKMASQRPHHTFIHSPTGLYCETTEGFQIENCVWNVKLSPHTSAHVETTSVFLKTDLKYDNGFLGHTIPTCPMHAFVQQWIVCMHMKHDYICTKLNKCGVNAKWIKMACTTNCVQFHFHPQ